jgi:IS30 family transposase
MRVQQITKENRIAQYRRMLAKGMDYRQIAKRLGILPEQAKRYIREHKELSDSGSMASAPRAGHDVRQYRCAEPCYVGQQRRSSVSVSLPREPWMPA